METASNQVAVASYKNQKGPGWIVAHELDEAGNILCVFVRIAAGEPAERFPADHSGQPSGPAPC